MIVLTIEAPEDSLVLRIAEGGQVRAGQELVALRSPKLEQQQSHLQALEEHLSFIERPFKDGRIDDEIAALATKEQILSDAVVQKTRMLDAVQIAVDVGHATPDDLAKAQYELDQSKSAQIDAHLASSHAIRKKDDALDKINSARNKITRDKSYIAIMTTSLTVVSVVDGTFVPQTLRGSFLRKGHVIGKVDR